MNGIFWNSIVAAAARRLVAMPSELAGYLVLGMLDAMGDQRGRVVAEDIQLNDGGRVVLLRVLPCDAGPSDQCLRGLLRQILDVSSSPSPALLRVADSSPRGRETTLLTELQTALIPVNRAAARRALSRLHRELLRLPHSADEKLESSTHSAEMVAPQDTCDAVAAEPKFAPTVEDSLHNLPTVARVEQPEPMVDDGNAVSPQPPVECQRALEIPDLELAGNPSVAKGQELFEDIPPVTDGNADALEVRLDTLVLAPVARVAQSVSDELPVAAVGLDEQNAGAPSGPTVRETTLVIAPVAPVAKLEQTLRLQIRAPASLAATTGSIDNTAFSQDSVVLEPTRALPLVTLKHRVYDQPLLVANSTGSCDVPELLDDDGAVSANLSELLALVDHSSDDATAVAESVKCERQAAPAVEVEPCFELTDAQANVVLSSWDATSMDTVVEVCDDEIVYDQAADEGIWLDVDCSDDGLFEAVAPRAVVLDQAAACVGWTVAGNFEDVAVGDVVAAELLVEDSECIFEPERDPESLQRAADEPASWLSVELEPMTLYRSESLDEDGPRSTVEGLSQQFGSEPAWSPGELCRNLRFVAGLDLSPSGTNVVTHTPPPTVETILLQQPEHSEPTRRLRRIGSMIAVVLAVSAGAYGVRAADGSVTAASRLSVDALGRICRATVTVSGVDARQQLRIRQAGDKQFREPTTLANAKAHFAGLRCGQDAELLVQDAATAGMRRIPISGDRLLPRDSHSWANVSVNLDGAS